MITQTYTISTIKQSTPPIVKMSQYDHGSRTITFSVVDGSGQAVVLTGKTVRVEGTRLDGHAFAEDCTVSGSTASFTDTSDMTNAPGAHPAELVIESDGDRLGTMNFVIAVETAAMDENADITEEDVSLFEQLLGSIEDATGAVEAEKTAALSAIDDDKDAALLAIAQGLASGSPLVVDAVADMTDQTAVYLYSGSESGYTAGNFYFWNGSAWVSGGTYGNPTVDAAFSDSSVNPVQNKVVSAAVSSLKSDLTHSNNQIDVLNEEVLPYVPIRTDWTNGVFESSGYVASDNFKYSKKLPAGEYIIKPTANIRWAAYYYVSDSSGTQIYSMSSNTRTFSATGEFIVTIGKDGGGSMDGLEDEIRNFSIARKNGVLLNNSCINSASQEINTDRYNHITYVDRMKYSSINIGNASAVELDTEIKFKGIPTIRLTTNPSETHSEIRINYAEPFTLLGTQEFEVYLYVKDATKVTGVRLSVPSSSWVKSDNLVNGWNKVRLSSNGAGNWSDSNSNSQIRILVYHTSGLTEDVYIGGIVQVKPQYGNMIIIADGPYYTVYTEAYPTLKAMDVPIVWALDPAQLDTESTSPRKLINKSELDLLAYDGISEFSFHNYDGTIMSTATKEEALADTLNSIRFLRQNGLQPNHIWRAAWLQNNCPNHQLADLEVEASASYNGTAGVVDYPFRDKYNIPRMGLGGRTTSWVDNLFEALRREHTTVLVYFHGVSDGERDISSDMLTYFLEKLEDAIDDGYLNPTTYDRLVSYYSKIE